MELYIMWDLADDEAPAVGHQGHKASLIGGDLEALARFWEPFDEPSGLRLLRWTHRIVAAAPKQRTQYAAWQSLSCCLDEDLMTVFLEIPPWLRKAMRDRSDEVAEVLWTVVSCLLDAPSDQWPFIRTVFNGGVHSVELRRQLTEADS